jgi:putative membrane-bound dehydrogenase-like protein
LKRIILLAAAVASLMSCSKKQDTSGFHVMDGLHIKLIASEPLIRDPVDIAFTPTGTLLVLEMPGYPYEDGQSRIMALTDANGDGDYDESTVFADSLLFGTSLLPWNDGVLVAAPPFLLHLKDVDRDGRAESRDTLMGGFAMENLQHNFNGLTCGLDNWIYIANGGNSGAPFWWGDTTTRMDLRNDDLRINLKEKKMERLGKSSGGFGLAMDNFGRWFTTHNLTHVSQIVFPSGYYQGIRIPQDHTLMNISDHDENGLARIYPIGEQETRVNHPEQSGYFSGACGITWYGDNALGEQFDNTLWVADVVLNLIHVDKLQQQGSRHLASRFIDKRDVIASEDRSFRPVNLVVGPEGAIYIVDMYRQVIEHPEWIPDEIEKQLDLAKGKEQGRIYRVTASARSTAFDFNSFTTEEGLVQNLSSPIQWVRMTAQQLLIGRGPGHKEVELLRALTQSENPVSRLHAYWTLHLTANLSSSDVITALNDVTPGVRENVLVMAEQYFSEDPALAERCIQLLGDDDARVRMQAALSLSVGMTKTPDATIKNKLVDAVISSTLKGGDEWNVTALTIASKEFPAAVFQKLVTLHTGKESSPLLLPLASLCSDKPEDARTVLEQIHQAEFPSTLKASIIERITAGGIGKDHATNFGSVIANHERTADDVVLAAFASLRNRLGLPQSAKFVARSQSALSTISDPSQPDSVRVSLMSMIRLLPLEKKAATLYACLDHRESLAIQEAALRQLSGYVDKSVGVELVSRWKTLGPQARRWASDLLIYRRIHHDALLTGLENGTINLGEMNFDLERRRALLFWTDDAETRRRASAFFTDEGVLTRKDAFLKMKPALTLQGSAPRGATVFESICGTCHKYENRGVDVGPVLTEINRKSKESVLHDILDPNAATDTKYISHRVETAEGMVHVGMIDSESDVMLTLKKAGGEKVSLPKKQITTLQSMGTSLMPEGLESNLSVQEMADLLEFLQKGGG